MRIACLISSLRLGGAERQLVGLAVSLHRIGHDVTVITYREGDFYAGVLKEAGVRMARIDGKDDLTIVRGLQSYVRASGIQTLLSFLAGTNVKACLVKRGCPSLKLIVSERNCNVRMLPHDAFRFALYRRCADCVVCNSFAQASFIRKHCPSLESRLCAIPNFVDTSTFSPSPAAGPVHRPVRILVTARVCRRKNVSGLIRAAAELDRRGYDFRIDWYGLGAEDRYSERCRREIQRGRIADRFFLHPFVHDVVGRYREADIFCLPSFYEGTSNSIAEALSCGLPVVCSDVSDASKYIHEGQNGFLFDPHSPDSMVRALVRALNLPEAALKSYGSSGRIIAQKSFPIERFTKAYTEMLSRVVR